MSSAAPWYPVNGRDLLESRKRGVSPSGPVVVTLSGGDFEGLLTLYVRPDMPLERMDWRMLVNLQVWVVADRTVPLGRVLRVVSDVAAARPAELALRFDAGSDWCDVVVGNGFHHVPHGPRGSHEHGFAWFPVRATWTELAARIKRALVQIHPIGTVL